MVFQVKGWEMAGSDSRGETDMNPETIALGKDRLVCPLCGTPFIQFAGVTPGHSQTVRKGQYFICAHCGGLSQVGDSALEIISEQKFKGLTNHIQQAVQAIVSQLKDTTVKQSDLN